MKQRNPSRPDTVCRLLMVVCALSIAACSAEAPSENAVDSGISQDAAADASTAPDTENVPDTATEPDTEKAPDTATVPDTETIPDTETATDSESVPDAEPVPDTESDPDTEPAPDAVTAPDTETDAGPPPPKCGDLILHTALKEACDDGNTDDCDGCSPTCQLETTLPKPLADDFAAITDKVAPLTKPGVLSTFVLHKPKVFAFMTDSADRAIGAAARYGQGRAAVFPHESFIGSGALKAKDGRPQLVANVIKWLGHNATTQNPTVGVMSKHKALGDFLKTKGFKVVVTTHDKLGGIDVFVTSAQESGFTKHAKGLIAFVKGGGGLLTAGQAWWWGSQNGTGNVPLKYAGNSWLNEFGITYTWEHTSPQSVSLAKAPHPWINAHVALNVASLHVRKLTNLTLGQRQLAAKSASYALRVLPLPFTGFYADAATFKKWHGPVVPTAKKPLKRAQKPLSELVVALDEKRAMSLPAKELWAHAAANDFPGAVPKTAKPTTVKVTVSATFNGLDKRFAYGGARADRRYSTGVYAVPGQVVTVTVPATHANKGLFVLIGAHSDSLWGKTEWKRMPRITRKWPLKAQKNEVGNVFGGPVYIAIPAGKKLGPMDVTISGAVKAPYFKAGTTSTNAWMTERNHPAPWAEIESKWMVLTVPSAVIRKLDAPHKVTDLWDEVMVASYDLAALPKGRERGERAVGDVQISAGWLHSGYPIMGHLVHPAQWVDVEKVKKSGDWGMFHEIGHNFQWRPWVIPKTTEVTVNLWSVHSCEKVVGKTGKCHGNAFPPKSDELVAAFIKNGATYKAWSTWGTLQMYLQLAKGFGWDAYKKVHAVYYKVAANQAAKNDQQRHDLYCERFSDAVGKDLGKFFAAWSMPVSKAGCRDKAKKYPPWLQDPMRQWLPYEAEVKVGTATAIAQTTATVGYDVVDPGGKGSTAYVVWGTKDAAKSPNSWGFSKSLGAPKAGKQTVALDQLKGATTYYFRVYIKNAKGSFWTTKAGSFVTK